jgi:transcriptional regulator with XRE-family HTH domain
MAHIREIFARNLKEKRWNSGLTQEQLADKVKVSTHHIAMMETARNLPALELVERLAEALDIEIYELFETQLSVQEELERLYETVAKDLEHVVSTAVSKAVEKALSGKCITDLPSKR